jgi:hypothetical protein
VGGAGQKIEGGQWDDACQKESEAHHHRKLLHELQLECFHTRESAQVRVLVKALQGAASHPLHLIC